MGRGPKNYLSYVLFLFFSKLDMMNTCNDVRVDNLETTVIDLGKGVDMDALKSEVSTIHSSVSALTLQGRTILTRLPLRLQQPVCSHNSLLPLHLSLWRNWNCLDFLGKIHLRGLPVRSNFSVLTPRIWYEIKICSHCHGRSGFALASMVVRFAKS